MRSAEEIQEGILKAMIKAKDDYWIQYVRSDERKKYYINMQGIDLSVMENKP